MAKSLIFLILYTILPFHDFHVSHTTLHYNTAQESIEITVRVAIDDLEKTLETKSSGKLKLGSPKENNSSDQYIKNYFDHHLKISINEKYDGDKNFESPLSTGMPCLPVPCITCAFRSKQTPS